jgi:hypothetical protein
MLHQEKSGNPDLNSVLFWLLNCRRRINVIKQDVLQLFLHFYQPQKAFAVDTDLPIESLGICKNAIIKHSFTEKNLMRKNLIAENFDILLC